MDDNQSGGIGGAQRPKGKRAITRLNGEGKQRKSQIKKSEGKGKKGVQPSAFLIWGG